MSSEHLAMKKLIENQLIGYLDGLPINELKSTSRKQCRLYLENKLNRNLSQYKQHIKSVLIGHVVTIKQRLFAEQQHHHHHHHDMNIKQENKENIKNVNMVKNGGKENSVISVEMVSDSLTVPSSKTDLKSSPSPSRKRKSYENSNNLPPSKRRRLSLNNHNTNNMMNDNDNDNNDDLKDEDDIDGTESIEHTERVQPESNININNDYDSNEYVKRHIDELRELDIKCETAIAEILETKRKNIEKKQLKFYKQIFASNGCESNQSAMEITQCHNAKIHKIERKYKRKICKLLKENSISKCDLQTTFYNEIIGPIDPIKQDKVKKKKKKNKNNNNNNNNINHQINGSCTVNIKIEDNTEIIKPLPPLPPQLQLPPIKMIQNQCNLNGYNNNNNNNNNNLPEIATLNDVSNDDIFSDYGELTDLENDAGDTEVESIPTPDPKPNQEKQDKIIQQQKKKKRKKKKNKKQQHQSRKTRKEKKEKEKEEEIDKEIDKKYKCSYKDCKYSTNINTDYKRHCMRHKGEKPHICQECGHGFTQKSDLKRHFRIHSGEKPFECSVCLKSFRTKQTLRTHFREHSKYQPYKCSFCTQSFKTSSQKLYHIKTQHKKEENSKKKEGEQHQALTN